MLIQLVNILRNDKRNQKIPELLRDLQKFQTAAFGNIMQLQIIYVNFSILANLDF